MRHSSKAGVGDLGVNDAKPAENIPAPERRTVVNGRVVAARTGSLSRDLPESSGCGNAVDSGHPRRSAEDTWKREMTTVRRARSRDDPPSRSSRPGYATPFGRIASQAPRSRHATQVRRACARTSTAQGMSHTIGQLSAGTPHSVVPAPGPRRCVGPRGIGLSPCRTRSTFSEVRKRLDICNTSLQRRRHLDSRDLARTTTVIGRTARTPRVDMGTGPRSRPCPGCRERGLAQPATTRPGDASCRRAVRPPSTQSAHVPPSWG